MSPLPRALYGKDGVLKNHSACLFLSHKKNAPKGVFLDFSLRGLFDPVDQNRRAAVRVLKRCVLHAIQTLHFGGSDHLDRLFNVIGNFMIGAALTNVERKVPNNRGVLGVLGGLHVTLPHEIALDRRLAVGSLGGAGRMGPNAQAGGEQNGDGDGGDNRSLQVHFFPCCVCVGCILRYFSLKMGTTRGFLFSCSGLVLIEQKVFRP